MLKNDIKSFVDKKVSNSNKNSTTRNSNKLFISD